MTDPMTPAPTRELHRIGLTGADVPLRVRERWTLAADEQAGLAAWARARAAGLAILSTCHRLELYLDGSDADARALRARLAALRPDLDALDLSAEAGAPALHHLLRVAAGLDSAILGEAQILGQVRRARAESEAAGALTPLLREALRAAVDAGRRVRSQTALGSGAASTASAAVRLVADRAGLRGRCVVVVGAGEIGRLLVKHLAGSGADVHLVSRSAPPIAGVTSHTPDRLGVLLASCDALFAATDRVVLRAADVPPGARLVAVDLGVPRNLAADVSRHPGVEVFDVDALRSAVDAGLAARRAAVPHAEHLVADALLAFDDVRDRLERERLIGEVRRDAERIRRDTLDYVCRKCADRTCGAQSDASGRVAPGDGACSDPDQLSRTLTTRLLHNVTRALRDGAVDLDEDAVRRLFALDAPADA